MERVFEIIMDFVLDTLPTLCILGLISALVFGGGLAAYYTIYTLWLYG